MDQQPRPTQDAPFAGILASYPRSGRTWLAGMIGEVLRRSVPLPKGTRVFATDHREEAITEFYEQFDGPAPIPVRLATHMKASEVPPVERVVLVVRDPFDSLVSYFHYTTKHTSQFDGDIGAFLQSRGYGTERLARWFNSWAPMSATALVVPYEQLRQHPATYLSKTLDAFGIEHDEDLEATAGRWDFERRQAREVERSESADANSLFVRSGAVGTGVAELTDAEVRYVHSSLTELLTPASQALMTELGYLGAS